MPIISHTDRKSWNGRVVVSAIYVLLLIGGLTMIYPFAVTLTGALGTPFDYERREAVPRYAMKREDRFLRMLCAYFPPGSRNNMQQLRAEFADWPESFQTWPQAGDDTIKADAWAHSWLQRIDGTPSKYFEAKARDYGAWMKNWNLQETILAFDTRHIAPFLRARYGTLDKFNAAWEVSVDDFSKIAAPEWSGEPIDQANYVPIEDTRYRDLLAFRQAYRDNTWTPYLRGDDASAGFLRPVSLRAGWENFAVKNDVVAMQETSKLAFPLAQSDDAKLLALWRKYLQTEFPLRHVSIPVNAARQQQFEAFLRARFRQPKYFERVTGERARRWSDIKLSPIVPRAIALPGRNDAGALSKIWIDFVRTGVPTMQWTIRETLPELAFQKYLQSRYNTIENLNQVWNTNFASWQQIPIPFGAALLSTFAHHESAILWQQSTSNYATAIDYLVGRGQAVRNTIILVVLSILITLTVNPLAGYALSRFRLRASEKIIVFCLATMAFPGAVAAIPGFLLLRDLGLLNTFWALVLPGAANGMAIFLLKGFFDSLPKELYEAATIDGAPEWQVFWHISIPLVKPILAVNMLSAFIASYNGWEWALIVCQDPRMWTVSVWTYQFYQTLGATPWIVMAAFILNSLPVLLVFLACQKIILRGIILPQMK